MNRIPKVSIAYVAIAVIIGVGVFFAFSHSHTAQAESTPIKVRWLLSHQPTSVFAHATEVFGQELSKDTKGRLALEVVTPQDIGVVKGDVSNSEIFKQLDSGNVQIASAYTVALGHSDPHMWALSLPYLFSSYEAIGPQLDGSTGQYILNSLASSASAHALAFTMSGGYRIIATKTKTISSVSDMKGLHIATSGGPVAEATLKALGAIPVSVDLESASQSFDPNTIDGVETTYSRLSEVLGNKSAYTAHINETDHSMFLTAIIAGNNFYDSLSPQDQQALKTAALAAAQVERQDSIALGEQVRTQLVAEGSQITPLSPGAKAAFKEATAGVASQFSSVVGPDIIQALLKRDQ